MREIVSPIQTMSEKDLKKKLPQLKEAVASKLEDSSVFRKSEFPSRFRSNVNSVTEFNAALDDLYDFAFDEKVWLGL